LNALHVYRAAILINIFIFAFIHPAIASDRLPVFVSIVPQKYFVQQIGKDLVDVKVMVQPGASPATYEPKPRQMSGLSKARVYFAIGVPFEKTWLRKIAAANPELKVIHTDHGIEKIPMATHQHEEDHHGKAAHEDHYEHNGLDPHIWLSPPLVKIQARRILAALQEVDPGHRNVYEANFQNFAARIDQLDADLKKTFAGKQGLQFMVFHPSWGYFARSYGLEQVAIEIEGKNPKPAQLKKLIEHAREKDIQVIFAQPQFSTKSAGLIAREINGQVAFADPLAEDWMANLNHVADNFKEALK
jgi:zinc transport system substrate-binding protein